MVSILPALRRNVVCALFAGSVIAQSLAEDPSSLSEFNLDATEAKVALELALEENALLQEKLAVAEATAAKLTESVAIAHGEAEVFRRQTGDLKLKLEALGLDAAGGSTGKLEQRLLKAVSDLRIADEERKSATEALLGLSEAVVRFLSVATTEDAEARLALEAQMRQVNQAMGKGSGTTQSSPGQPNLMDAAVISIKDELSLVVVNIGTLQGVKVGMPFTVFRGERMIGAIRVIDVRDRICGALVQSLNSEKEKIAVGDRLRVQARP